MSTGHNGAQAAPITTGAASPRPAIDASGCFLPVEDGGLGDGPGDTPDSLDLDHCPGCAHRYGAGCGCACCKTRNPAPTTGGASPRAAHEAAAGRYAQAKEAVRVARALLDMALAEREDAEEALADLETDPDQPVPYWPAFYGCPQ